MPQPRMGGSDRKETPIRMAIREQWDRLDPATRKWLTDNPGCLLLPHAITASISKESSEAIECERNSRQSKSGQVARHSPSAPR